MAVNVRAALHSAGEEIAVEVDQRALIDKVLARYSGEFTVYRELLQNSEDAGASTVQIRFSSASDEPVVSSNLPDLNTRRVGAVTVRNDGIAFRDQDWNRLKTIAEGNPDESKIGAFGVGYYSVFSICEEPVVTSGARSMLFYFKGKALFVRAGPNPNEATDKTSDGKPWTTFALQYREAAPMPNPESFARFLAASFAFTNSLRSLSFWLDDIEICSLSKTLAPPKPLTVPRSLYTTSPKRFMVLQSAESIGVQIDARIRGAVLTTPSAGRTAQAIKTAAANAPSFLTKMLLGFGSTSSDGSSEPIEAAPTVDRDATLEATFFMRVIAGHVNVSVPRSAMADLERATKKKPPSKTKVQVIYSSKDESEASKKADSSARRVFDSLATNLQDQGRIAIGFLTHQTTGSAASVAASFIPTVERESLDLQHPATADWNRELLWVAGLMSRIIYEDELADVGRLWTEIADDKQAQALLVDRAAHVSRFFTFAASTPSPLVSTDQEHAFMTADRNTDIRLISDQGPKSIKDVRMPNRELAAFVKGIAVIPDGAITEMDGFIAKLRDRGLRDISLDDVFAELSSRTLSESEARACLSWWISLAANRSYKPELRSKLLSSAIMMVNEGKDERAVPLATIQYFLDTRLLPPDLPLPPTTLPHSLGRFFRAADLKSVYGWEELPISTFVRHLLSNEMNSVTSQTSVLNSPVFAEKILTLLARIWSNITTPQQNEIVQLLQASAVIPTRHGLRKPGDAYMPSVTMFEDLDVVAMPSVQVGKALDRLLLLLGVRKHVDLQIVFNRLLGAGSWSHEQMVKYLISVKDTLSPAELDRLRKTAFLPKEGEALLPGPPDAKTGNPGKPRTVRYCAHELYEPSEAMRDLGMPLLAWTGSKWRSQSDEARFLSSLGLHKTPPVDQLLTVASSSDSARAQKALHYFLASYAANAYSSSYAAGTHALAFVPCVKPDGTKALGLPLEVYTNPACATMGFSVLDDAHHTDAFKFKLRTDPPPADLVKAISTNPPLDSATATKVFGYLSTQIANLSTHQIGILKEAKIVPVFRRPGDTVSLEAPSTCFVASPESTRGIYASLLSFVDFGLAAQPFLRACGVKNEPSVGEIATLLLKDPTKIYSLAGSAERYLQVLRQICASSGTLSSAVKRQMRQTAWMLGSKRISMTSDSVNADEEDDPSETATQWVLSKPTSLVIVDDINMYNSFAATVLAAPQEDVLEIFAEELGAQRISKLVRDKFVASGAVNADTKRTQVVRPLIIERAELFLFERRSARRTDIKHDANWLKKNLNVVEVGKLELHRTLDYLGATRTAVKPASAAAMPVSGKLQLALANNIELDWYEVAEALCRELLSKQRVDDALLFMTLLATDLKVLKRRGYNGAFECASFPLTRAVDRILTARKLERQAAEEQARQAQLAAEVERANRPAQPSKEQTDSYVNQLQTVFPDARPDHLRSVIESEKSMEGATDALLKGDYPRKTKTPSIADTTSTLNDEKERGFMSTWKKRLAGSSSSSRSPSINGPPLGAMPIEPPSAYQQPVMSPPAPQASNTGSSATSTNDIKTNVLRAIAASKPDNAAAVQNLPSQRQVKEAESYCDASHATDLVYVCDVNGLRFYFDRRVPDHSLALDQYGAALRRFVDQIIKPLGETFNMSLRALHCFYDCEPSPLIAFNRSGAIYVNLRYYIRVQAGDLDDALISWFMSLAHELAHNLVESHNAQHGFWTSSIAEQSMLRLAVLIGKSRRPAISDIANL